MPDTRTEDSTMTAPDLPVWSAATRYLGPPAT